MDKTTARSGRDRDRLAVRGSFRRRGRRGRPERGVHTRAMLLALLDLANARLRRGGRIAAWLRNPVDTGAGETNGNTGRRRRRPGRRR